MDSVSKRSQLYQHHAGMAGHQHPNFTSFIPTSKPMVSTAAEATTDRPSNYLNQPSYSLDKQQKPLYTQQEHHDANQPRKRTRATPEQLSVLEKTFSVNPSPNNRVREQLSRELGMSERSIQIWFQNRRAKVKNMAKRSSLLHDETMRMQYYAATAAAAACQAASLHQQHTSPDGTPVSNPDLYYYYYYYYYNQQQQQQQQQQQAFFSGTDGHSSILPLGALKSSPTQSTPPPPPPPPMPTTNQSKPWSSLSTPPPSSIYPSTSTPISVSRYQQQQRLGTSSPDPPSSVGSMVTDAAGGRVRSHSVGHYPYNPYHRPNSRPGSSEPAAGYYHRRHHSSSTSPAPHVPAPPPPPPPPPLSMNMWSSSSSTMMMGPNGMIPEEGTLSQEMSLNQLNSSPIDYDPSTWSSGMTADHDLTPMSVSLIQDDRLGTPMSMDDLTSTVDNDQAIQHRISVETLQIGTWKRMSLQPQDLECFYDAALRCMVWRIQDGQQRFKMHIKLDSIQKIQLDPLMERLGCARLTLTINQPETISFYMEEGYTGGELAVEHWTQCRDFTQDKQATNVYTHYIDGPALALRAEWLRLAAHDQQLNELFHNNMVQPLQQQQYYAQQQQVVNSNALYHTARGPHGQTMLSNSTRSREVTPADVMMVLQQQDNQSMLSLMEKDQGRSDDAQDLLLFQGV